MSKVPTIVLGGTGYVAGELLRLLSQHPSLELAAAVSTSRAAPPQPWVIDRVLAENEC